MSRHARCFVFFSLLLAACDPQSADDPEAGFETGPCIDDGCFEGLACLSDLCVGEEGTGGPTTNSASGNSNSGNSDSGPDSTSGPDDSGPDDSGPDDSGPDDSGPDDSTSGPDDPGSSSDTADPPGACDVFEQDCPDGYKCAPWANDGGDAWNAAHCVEVADSPLGAGEPCVTSGASTSGEDECGPGLMCWGVDPSEAGTCVELCTGTAGNPQCDDPFLCSVYFDGALPLCIAGCDPIAQNCPLDLTCYSFAGELECGQDNSGASGAFLDECTASGTCDPGFGCILGDSIGESCEAFACCTPFCELASDDCPAGTQCASLFEAGAEPPGFELIGWCVE